MTRLQTWARSAAVLLVGLLVSSAAAQMTSSAPAAPAPGAAATTSAELDQMMIGGDAVRIRSGPGLQYYEVAKLNKDTVVTVADREGGWTGIRPPGSVVALVKRSDVVPGDGNTAAVTVDMARVYAKDPSSDRTWAVIDQLPKDTVVTTITEQGPYYSIVMPEGAKVYVDNRYVAPIRRVEDTEPVRIPTGTQPTIKKFQLDPQTDAFENASAMLRTEMAKPLLERDFSAVEAALEDVRQRAEMAYMKAEAASLLSAVAFQKELQEGMKKLETDREALKEQLDTLQKREDERLAAEQSSPTDAMKMHTFEGILMPMQAKMAYQWRLQDADGRFVCLLDGVPEMIGPLAGKIVRVWGEREYRVDLKLNVCHVKRIEEVAAE